jgi:hypothetical protein
VIITVIILAGFIIPIVFKDDIKALVDKELEGAVNADVYFDADLFDISLFSNFPNLSVTIGDFGVINREPFDGEILFAAHEFKLVVDLGSLIFGPKPRVNALILDNVRINVIVLEDGSANYDIVPPGDTAEAVDEVPEDTAEEEAAAFSLAIKKWELKKVNLLYDDRQSKTKLTIRGLDHTGSGDFTQDIFDLVTNTTVQDVALSFEGSEYVANKSLDVDLTLNMNLPESRYTFKDNRIGINDFAFGFDGAVVLGEDYDIDLSFESRDNTFKSLLSLVPGMYSSSFESLKTEGELSFGGKVKGVYSEANESLPAFDVYLKVVDGMFSYPDLPKAVENVNIDLSVFNESGNIDQTTIDLKSMHLDFGTNPVDARLRVEDLVRFPIDAKIDSKLNLGELTTIFPMEGMTLRGFLDLQAEAKGYYDSIEQVIPQLSIMADLKDGYAKYEEYPVPLDDIHFNATVTNPSGKYNDTKLQVQDFVMLMEGEKLEANLQVFNLDDASWDIHVHGGIDLEKLTKIFPQEGMTLAGKIKADIDTKGKLSDLEAERYDKMPTKGSMSINAFSYRDETNLPMGMRINESLMTFNPRQVTLENLMGSVGNSDIQLRGFLSNYLGFVMSDTEILFGKLTFSSNQFDVNEWMTTEVEETDDTIDEPDTSAISPVKIPENIDFLLVSTIDELLYDNLTLENLNGNILVKGGRLDLNNLNFDLLNGRFTLNGGYDSRDIEHPKFDFDFAIQELSIPQAYAAFNTVQTAAPIAKLMNGDFSTNFQLSGELTDQMEPAFETLQGSGLIKIAQAAIKGSKALTAINQATSLGLNKNASSNQGGDVSIKDVLMQTEIRDGRVHIQPTNLSLGGYESTLAGSTGLAGDLDLTMDMVVPAGAAGQAFNQAVSGFLGSGDPNSSNVNLKLGITGTQSDPRVKILGTSVGNGGSVQDAVKEAAADKALEELGITGKEGESAEETLKREAEEAKKKAEEEAKRKAEEEAEKRKKELEEKAKKEAEKAKEKLKKLFGG